ncbi:MAG: cell division protein FtsQ/DivIB [Pseudomonadota bacterium]
MASNRQVGKFRSNTARGASVRMPAQDRQGRYAFIGRTLVALLGVGAAGIASFGIYLALQQVSGQKIENVVIEGEMNFVSEDEIKDTVSRFVSESLVALDLETLKQELEMLPWISRVAVQREWPDKLIINVEEELAIARWRDSELLNQQGQIFVPEEIQGLLNLPRLSGPVNSEKEVMEQYQKFNQLMYPLGVRIRDLSMNDRGALTMLLTNGVKVKLGKDDVLERVRRLVTFMESRYSSDLLNMESIDLRYTNGIAVSPRIRTETNIKQGEVVMAQ